MVVVPSRKSCWPSRPALRPRIGKTLTHLAQHAFARAPIGPAFDERRDSSTCAGMFSPPGTSPRLVPRGIVQHTRLRVKKGSVRAAEITACHRVPRPGCRRISLMLGSSLMSVVQQPFHHTASCSAARRFSSHSARRRIHVRKDAICHMSSTCRWRALRWLNRRRRDLDHRERRDGRPLSVADAASLRTTPREPVRAGRTPPRSRSLRGWR